MSEFTGEVHPLADALPMLPPASTECAMLVHEECKGKARRPGASRCAALIECTCYCHEETSVLSYVANGY